WQADRPIRGGVPVCFPWVGRGKDGKREPQHGFVRLCAWQLESIERREGGVSVTLSTGSDAETRELWPHDFVLRHRVTFGRELAMALEFTNTGSGEATIEEAQHTYFAVGDVRRINVKGLTG